MGLLETLNRLVTGSSPVGATKQNNDLRYRDVGRFFSGICWGYLRQGIQGNTSAIATQLRPQQGSAARYKQKFHFQPPRRYQMPRRPCPRRVKNWGRTQGKKTRSGSQTKPFCIPSADDCAPLCQLAQSRTLSRMRPIGLVLSAGFCLWLRLLSL